LQDGSWLLIRFSGTEPLIRIYAETSSPERVQRYLARGRDLAGTKYAWPGVARQVVGFYRMVHAVNGDRPA